MMNKNLKKKVSVVAFSIIGGIAFSCGATTVMQEVSASNDVFENAQVQMISGASVRYYKGETDDATNEESGIRFSAVINSEVYNELEALENETVKVSYGMVIAPYEYVKNHEFNEATLFGVNGDKVYTWEGETVAEGTTYQKIAHVTYDTIIASEVEGYVGYHEIKGSILKIKAENLTKEFVGRGYVKYEYEEENGAKAVKYKFASYENGKVENNARSIAYVSQVAIEKGDAAADFVKKQYVSKVEAVDTTYTVETYVGETLVKSEVFEGVKVNEELTVEPADYNGFINVTDKTQKSGKVYANGKLVLKHVYEQDNTSEYQVKNGGFEDGLTNWTVTGDIGDVSSETHYWKNENGGYAFGLDGEKMFSNYAKSSGDGSIGYLQSEPFTIGVSGWLTFKLGGAKNAAVTYVEIIDNENGEIVKRLYNGNWAEFTNEVKTGCTLNAYKVDLSKFVGKEVYIRVCDYGTEDYGVLFLDSFNALHISEPNDSFAVAYEVNDADKYSLFNGNFDRGMNGWIENVTEYDNSDAVDRNDLGNISNATEYWAEKYKFNNCGNFYSAYQPDDRYEKSKGTLRSAPFTIGGCGYVTFALGGMKDFNYIWLEVVDAYTGEVYAKYYNDCQDKCTLIYYKANLSRFMGKTVYFNFVDNATSNYGLIFCDEFITYYESVEKVPNYNIARNLLTDVINGSFESFENNFVGWNKDGDAWISTDNVYWWDNSTRWDENGNTVHNFHKEGNNFYVTGDAGTSTLTSSTIKLTDDYISFKFGAAKHDTCYVEVVLADGENAGKVIAKVTNSAYFNDPLMAQILLRKFVNVSEYIGQNVFIRVVDNQVNDFGFLTFDDLRVNMNENEAADLLNAEKAYYGSYYQSTLDSTSERIGADTKNIINAVRKYYADLSLPA